MANLSEFKVGDNLLTYGLDMGCHKCVVRTKVVGMSKYGITTYSDGCRILTTWDDMDICGNDYFLYTEEQEKRMQAYCDKLYNEWEEACRRQMERAKKYHMERNEKAKSLIKEKGYHDGQCMIFDLSGKNNFYRWKKYDILYINENLQVFGMADDEDTMFLDLDDLCVPTQQEIISELENEVA